MQNDAGFDPAVIFKAYDRIADAWQLSLEQRSVLLGVPEAQYHDWKIALRSPVFSADQITKVSHLLNIYDALHRLFGDPDFANSWIRIENADLAGKTALGILLSGTLADFQAVHVYLQAVLDL
jgi:hypothetical protein